MVHSFCCPYMYFPFNPTQRPSQLPQFSMQNTNWTHLHFMDLNWWKHNHYWKHWTNKGFISCSLRTSSERHSSLLNCRRRWRCWASPVTSRRPCGSYWGPSTTWGRPGPPKVGIFYKMTTVPFFLFVFCCSSNVIWLPLACCFNPSQVLFSHCSGAW